RRRRDRRPGRAHGRRADRGAPERAGPLSRPPLGAALARGRRVARLLATEAGLPRRLARPPRQGRSPRRRVGRRRVGLRLPRTGRRAGAARTGAYALLARAPVPARLTPP